MPTARPISRCVHSHQKIVLKAAETHASIERVVLRNSLVLLELGLPLHLGKRRQRAHHRLPFGDRQTGLGEPRRAADQHHRQHERRDGIEPELDCANMACGDLSGHRRLDLIACSERADHIVLPPALATDVLPHLV